MQRLFQRRQPSRQEVFGFVRRIERRDRRFRVGILLVTALAMAGIVAASPDLRSWLSIGAMQVRRWALIGSGLNPPTTTRQMGDEEWKLRRDQKVFKAEQALTSFLENSSPEVRRLFDEAGMSTNSAIHRWGRGDQVFMFSSGVFQADDHGRSYRLRPSTKSVWLRELVMKGGPHGLLLIPDRPELREIASKAGAIVVEESVQNTNSWGLRGPEPDMDAKAKIMVLGDSFMEGMFIGDADTPPEQLRRHLSKEWKCTVSVLNTGHVGYSPEQYYYTFMEYIERFRPHFIVMSVCHNDFGDDQEVLSGKGMLYGEAAHWLNLIIERCRGKNIAFLLVPVPHQENVDNSRSNGHYPNQIFRDVVLAPKLAISLLDQFIDENLRLRRDEPSIVAGAQTSVLYNASIKDGHFSAIGSALWARCVGNRVQLLMDPSKPIRQFFDPVRPGK